MESFYQESGRAGRDQLPSRSILYYGLDDRKRMEFILSSTHTSKQSRSSISSDGLLKKSLTNFSQMVEYCEGSGCRRKKILESFGEQVSTSFCQKICDACMHPNKIAADLGKLTTSQSARQKIFIKSSFNNVSEDIGTEFWNREDETESPDEDISDSDDGTEVLEKIQMSKVSSKSKVNMKIDALQRAEESYYKKKDKKQTGDLSNKIIVPDKLREASKIRLLNGLKRAQERNEKSIDLHAASVILEVECYKKYGKLGKTFYISQVASIIRWLSTSTYEDICNRISDNCTPHIEVECPASSSIPQDFVCNEKDFLIKESIEGTDVCCKPETSLQQPPWVKSTSQKNELPSIPSFSEFVKQQGKLSAFKENSQSSSGMQKKSIAKDDAKKRPRLQ